MLNPINLKLIGDSALFMSRHFRTNFGPFWTLSNPGDNLKKIKEAATDVLLEQVHTLDLNQQVQDSFESWLEVHLENCVLSFDESQADLEQVPHLDVLEGVNALHAHAEEAERQFGLAGDLDGIDNMKQVLDLMVALWGRLRPFDNDEDMDNDDIDNNKEKKLKFKFPRLTLHSAQNGLKLCLTKRNIFYQRMKGEKNGEITDDDKRKDASLG